MKKWATLIISVYLFVFLLIVTPCAALGAGLSMDFSTASGMVAPTGIPQPGQTPSSHGAAPGYYSSGLTGSTSGYTIPGVAPAPPGYTTSGNMKTTPGAFSPGATQTQQTGAGASNVSPFPVDSSQLTPFTQNFTVTNSAFDNFQNPTGQSGLSEPQLQQQCQQYCQKIPLPLQQQCQQQCQQRLTQQILPQHIEENVRPQRIAVPDLSPVERMMSGDDRDSDGRPKSIPFAGAGIYQYGYSFFQSGTSFSPLTDVPVGPEYIIGAGDRIILTAWGSLEGTFELEVNREGEITLPKVGIVKVQGVSYDQLPKVLKSSLSRVFKDFQLSTTLGRTRFIKVYLVGDIVSPGDYTVSSLATVINALGAAGGPTKNGSLRNIQVKRGGKVAETVDLYEFFLKGNKSRDIRLQPGDTIFVPPIGSVAGIVGNVRRPAIYELKDEKTLKDLLALANGINPSGYLQRVLITSIIPHDKAVATDFSLDPKLSGNSLDDLTGGIVIKDLDYVKIFPIDTTLRGYVRLDGYILRPGHYALHPGMKVSELLKEENQLPEYADWTAELVRLFPPDLHPEYLSFSPAKALAGDPMNNMELREFDRIRIFSRWELEEMPRVRIIGEVQRPGDYRLMRNMTVRDLLLQAGNPKVTAYLVKAEIIRTKHDGATVTSSPVAINLGEALKGNPRDNILLEPLDELIIKRIPNWLDETERYATIKGEVLFPGTYPIFKGERLFNLIERAGGYTDKAYLFGARFTRQSVQKLQQERMDAAIARMEKDIAYKQQGLAAAVSDKNEADAARLALEGIKNSMEKLKTTKVDGRISIKLEPLDQFRQSTNNLELMGGDTLEIPQSTMAVTVLGEVASPTTSIWLPDKDASYYLDMAGGPTDASETDEMYVIMADGSVRGKKSDGMFSFFRGGRFMSTKLHPGDTLVVPQRLERISWMKEIKDITQILSNIAVAAGVPLAIIKR